MKIIKLKSLLNEMPFGPQGYFPPMGADTPRRKGPGTPKIFLGNTALSVAMELKKFIDKIQPEFEEVGRRIVPIVNYEQSKHGTLALGYLFTMGTKPATKNDPSHGTNLERKYDGKLEAILKKGGTEIQDMYHAGIYGRYKGEPYKSGIVRSIVTPEQAFSDEMENKIRQIFEK